MLYLKKRVRALIEECVIEAPSYEAAEKCSIDLKPEDFYQTTTYPKSEFGVHDGQPPAGFPILKCDENGVRVVEEEKSTDPTY